MEDHENVHSFINFLKGIYEEFKSNVEYINHFDWKGSETNTYLDGSDVNKPYTIPSSLLENQFLYARVRKISP